jgi:hypothetical protein
VGGDSTQLTLVVSVGGELLMLKPAFIFGESVRQVIKDGPGSVFNSSPGDRLLSAGLVLVCICISCFDSEWQLFPANNSGRDKEFPRRGIRIIVVRDIFAGPGYRTTYVSPNETRLMPVSCLSSGSLLSCRVRLLAGRSLAESRWVKA